MDLKTDLKEKREQWEGGLEVKTEIRPDDFTLLVVLEAPKPEEGLDGYFADFEGPDPERYHCHRYFKIGDNWEVSVDGQNVSLDQVWEWLKDPCAIRS